MVVYESSRSLPDSDFKLFITPEAGRLGFSLLTYRETGQEGIFFLSASPAPAKRSGGGQRQGHHLRRRYIGQHGRPQPGAGQGRAALLPGAPPAKRPLQYRPFRHRGRSAVSACLPATAENRRQAMNFIEPWRAAGGTNCDEAMSLALAAKPDAGDRPTLHRADHRRQADHRRNRRGGAAEQDRAGQPRPLQDFPGGHRQRHQHPSARQAGRADPDLPDLHRRQRKHRKRHRPLLRQDPVPGPELAAADYLRRRPHQPALSTRTPRPLQGLDPDRLRPLPGLGPGRRWKSSAGSTAASSEFTFPVDFPEQNRQNDFLPSLWAARRVGFLLDQIRLHGENKELRRRSDPPGAPVRHRHALHQLPDRRGRAGAPPARRPGRRRHDPGTGVAAASPGVVAKNSGRNSAA